jgi:hypothetical protein
MGIFLRRQIAPVIMGQYVKFRPFVREDFIECCAYCLLHERLAGGKANFELDHFRPKSLPQFAKLINDFFNLYYACHVCNHIKAFRWPSPEQEAKGYVFIDFCQEKFSLHFREDENGRWIPQTLAGEYTAERLNLNSNHLVELRAVLTRIARIRGLERIDWDNPSKTQIANLLG